MLSLESTSRLETQLTLSSYSSPSLIVPKLGARDAAGIIAELGQKLQQHGCVSDLLPLYNSALNREFFNNSAQECGIAIPHARLGTVKKLQFALGCTPEPIRWHIETSSKVSVIFLLAVPATDAASYLHLLASIARLGRQPEILTRIRHASSSGEIMDLLGTVPLRI